MAKLTSLSQRRASALNRRRRIEIEIPEWVMRLLEYRVEEANDGASPEEQLQLNDVIEWYLISPLTVREVPLVEERIPGFTAALVRWLETSTYAPPAV